MALMLPLTITLSATVPIAVSAAVPVAIVFDSNRCACGGRQSGLVLATDRNRVAWGGGGGVGRRRVSQR